jgi:hypothetical protein
MEVEVIMALCVKSSQQQQHVHVSLILLLNDKTRRYK